MTTTKPLQPSTLADARRVAVVSVLAYVAAIALVAAGVPAFLEPLEHELATPGAIPVVARSAAAVGSEPQQ